MKSQLNAKKLHKKYYHLGDIYPVTTYAHAKQCAIIEVDALIAENKSILKMLKVYGDGRNRLPLHARIAELEQVKEEIEKL